MVHLARWAIIIGVLCISSNALYAEPYAISYPDFNQSYWEEFEDGASGKTKRGVFGTILSGAGLVGSIPLLLQMRDDPDGFAAPTFMLLSTLGSLLAHSIRSISMGQSEKDKASQFIAQYTEGTQLDPQAEKKYFLEDNRLSASKVQVFGTYLLTQSALAMGAALTYAGLQYRNNEDHKKAIIGFSILGGLLLGGGIFMQRSKRIETEAYQRELYENEYLVPTHIESLDKWVEEEKRTSRIRTGFGYAGVIGGGMILSAAIAGIVRIFAINQSSDDKWYNNTQISIPLILAGIGTSIPLMLLGIRLIKETNTYREQLDSYSTQSLAIAPHIQLNVLLQFTQIGIQFRY